MTLTALRYVLFASVFGHLIALKAVDRMRNLWRARIAVSLVSLLSMVAFVRLLGRDGAGWSGVLSAGCYAAILFAVYRKEMAGIPLGPGGTAPSASREADGPIDPRSAGAGQVPGPY